MGEHLMSCQHSRIRIRRRPRILLPTFVIAASLGHGPITAQDSDTDVQLARPRIDVTAFEDLTTTLAGPLALEAAEQIGPGSALIITIPGEGRFGCTANFVWADGRKLYLGAAGHCFLPAAMKSTHGPGADYDPSGVEVSVCVNNCDGNFRSMTLVGELVLLGRVAYARQTDALGEEQVGHDFGVVEIPDEFAPQVRRAMPVFGGPTGVDTLDTGELGCHFGHGLVVGETFATKARVGIGGGSDRESWMGDFAGAFGDSGSAMVSCVQEGLGFSGRGAVGVLTHLGLSVCPCDVKFKGLKIKAEHGVIFGTTVARAIDMATEAGLRLAVSLP
jgi:hypothetical protein